jgi:hypothetical protein
MLYSPALPDEHTPGLIELESQDKAVEKEMPPSVNGASLMYAGYPYDPYASGGTSRSFQPI